MKNLNTILAFLATTLLAGGCATQQRPTLVQNQYMESVDAETARRDIDECLDSARELQATFEDGAAGEAVQRTAQGAATSAATGAVMGGDPLTGVISSVVFNGVGGLVNMIFNPPANSTELDPQLQAYVEDCLRSKGYEIEAWK